MGYPVPQSGQIIAETGVEDERKHNRRSKFHRFCGAGFNRRFGVGFELPAGVRHVPPAGAGESNGLRLLATSRPHYPAYVIGEF
jgi:hypothetical protein